MSGCAVWVWVFAAPTIAGLLLVGVVAFLAAVVDYHER